MLEVSVGLLLVGATLVSFAHYLYKVERELRGRG